MSRVESRVTAGGVARPGRAKRGWGDYLFVAPAVLFILLTMIYPVFVNLEMGLRDMTITTLLGNQAPFIGLENYRTVLEDDAFWNGVRLSLLFTIGCLVFQFTLGFALALFFNRPFPGIGVLRALLMLAWVLPGIVTANLFRFQLDGTFGVINYLLVSVGALEQGRSWLIDPSTALGGTILANVWIGVPFNMVLLLAGLQNIPDSLYEAASIDGASLWQQFTRITFPIMVPVSLSVLLLGLIYTFKVFDLIYVMTGGGPVDTTTVLPLYIYQLSFQQFRFGQGAAAATLMLLSLCAVGVFYLRTVQREESWS